MSFVTASSADVAAGAAGGSASGDEGGGAAAKATSGNASAEDGAEVVAVLAGGGTSAVVDIGEDDSRGAAGEGDVVTVRECIHVAVAAVAGPPPPVVAAVDIVESDSDCAACSSGSSSSSSTSRSRSRGHKRAGAAAGAALLTAAEPMDVDECERVVAHDISLPTGYAMQLQSDGIIIEVMANTGAVVEVSPQEDMQNSIVRVSGTATVVGRAVWKLRQLYREHMSPPVEPMGPEIREVEIPARQVGAAVGHNGCDLPTIRSHCGGIMVALMPPSCSGGAFKACIGPGTRREVQLVVEELRRRMRAADEFEALAKSGFFASDSNPDAKLETEPAAEKNAPASKSDGDAAVGELEFV